MPSFTSVRSKREDSGGLISITVCNSVEREVAAAHHLVHRLGNCTQMQFSQLSICIRTVTAHHQVSDNFYIMFF